MVAMAHGLSCRRAVVREWLAMIGAILIGWVALSIPATVLFLAICGINEGEEE